MVAIDCLGVVVAAAVAVFELAVGEMADGVDAGRSFWRTLHHHPYPIISSTPPPLHTHTHTHTQHTHTHTHQHTHPLTHTHTHLGAVDVHQDERRRRRRRGRAGRAGRRPGVDLQRAADGDGLFCLCFPSSFVVCLPQCFGWVLTVAVIYGGWWLLHQDRVDDMR